MITEKLDSVKNSTFDELRSLQHFISVHLIRVLFIYIFFINPNKISRKIVDYNVTNVERVLTIEIRSVIDRSLTHFHQAKWVKFRILLILKTEMGETTIFYR